MFQLNPAQGAAAVPNDPPVVVFAMHPEEAAPVSAVIVTPQPGGEEAEVLDLRQLGSGYTAAYAGTGAPAHGSSAEHTNEANASAPGAIAEPTGTSEEANGQAPEANLALLAAIKASWEFQTIEGRLVAPLPTDSWQEDDAYFFAFQLLPTDGPSPNGHEPPLAVFAMRPPEHAPISAVVVTPRSGGEDAEVVDLRQPDSAYVAALSR